MLRSHINRSGNRFQIKENALKVRFTLMFLNLRVNDGEIVKYRRRWRDGIT
jgi:hypothetical protein